MNLRLICMNDMCLLEKNIEMHAIEHVFFIKDKNKEKTKPQIHSIVIETIPFRDNN